MALLSSGQGSIIHVSKLVEGENWDEAIIVTNNAMANSFKCAKPHRFIIINDEWPVSEIISSIKKGLSNEHGEVGLNFVSGSGKEHMAVVAGVIQAGLAFRLIAVTKDGIKEL